MLDFKRKIVKKSDLAVLQKKHFRLLSSTKHVYTSTKFLPLLRFFADIQKKYKLSV